MKTYLLPALAALLLLAACKKENPDPDGLVPATQEGRNTGDFLLNGAAFRPRSRVSSPATKPVGAYWGHSSRGIGRVQISFFREDDDKKARSLNLFIANIRLPGTYRLTDLVSPFVIPGPQSSAQYDLPYTTPSYRPIYVTGPTSPGAVIITRFDTVAHIVSGTFEAKLREYQGLDSLVITKGRFDCTF